MQELMDARAGGFISWWIQELDSMSWIQGAGFKELDSRSWIQGAGFKGWI